MLLENSLDKKTKAIIRRLLKAKRKRIKNKQLKLLIKQLPKYPIIPAGNLVLMFPDFYDELVELMQKTKKILKDEENI